VTGAIAGIVLTGGASKRMGVDKTMISIDGEPCIARIERALCTVASPCLEVGPGKTSFPSVVESAPGNGPLMAIAAGYQALCALGHDGPALVVAGDLPLLTDHVLRWLATRPGNGSVVPVVDGWRQPLLARWSPWDLRATVLAVGHGERSLCGFPGNAETMLATEAMWSTVATAEVFFDIDTPDDLRRLGLIADQATTVRHLGTRGRYSG
jgi:molybdenum cofactor guanylyltransferase